jgi:hypothetical protein
MLQVPRLGSPSASFWAGSHISNGSSLQDPLAPPTLHPQTRRALLQSPHPSSPRRSRGSGSPTSPGGGGRCFGSSAYEMFLSWGHQERKVSREGWRRVGTQPLPHPLLVDLLEVSAGTGVPTGRCVGPAGDRSKKRLAPSPLSCRASSEMIRPLATNSSPHPTFLTDLSGLL